MPQMAAARSIGQFSGVVSNDAFGAYEERFPPTRLSVGCGFGKKTFAGTRGNAEDAPIAVIGKREGVCALSRGDLFKSPSCYFPPGN
jgi:hypothetical protein